MSVAWDIRGSVITLRIEVQAAGDLRQAIIEAMSSPKFPPIPAVMLDSRRATESPAPDALRARGNWIATLLSHRHGSRCALLIGPKPYQQQSARMLSAIIQSEGIDTEVFRNTRAARRWLAPSSGRTMDGRAVSG